MPLMIAEGLVISDGELTFTASRGGGPGGQHVNKTSSKITLRFEVSHAPCLVDAVRARLLTVLGDRVEADGTVRGVCQASPQPLRESQDGREAARDPLGGSARPRGSTLHDEDPSRRKEAVVLDEDEG